MIFKRVDHVEIVPKNAEKTIDFYVNILGFRIKSRNEVKMPPMREVIYLELGDTVIEIISIDKPKPKAQNAGANVVQLFDSWAGILSEDDFVDFALPAARTALEYQAVPTIYFAPHGPHLLPHFAGVGATAYGVDWRLPLDEAWRLLGDSYPIQGKPGPGCTPHQPQSSAIRGGPGTG